MTLPFSPARKVLVILLFTVFLTCLVPTFDSIAQEKHFPQTAGVDDSKMGAYRALGQLIYAASQKGDNAGAARLARILERTWDKAEDYGGDTALSKTNRALFDQIDKTMDQFIAILIEHANSAPDSAKVKAAYNSYLDKLKLAD